MILAITNRGDLTADWLILELQRRRARYVRLNTEDYPGRVGLTWSDAGEAVLTTEAGELPLREFAAVWYRRPLPARVDARDPELARWASGEAQEALDGLWRTHDALWVNHPDANLAAEGKPQQLRAARKLGFDVPQTLVTTDLERVRAFAAAHPDGIVCKSLVHGVVGDEARGGRVLWTTRLAPGELDGLAELGPGPYLFQELVAKECDVRVTVIDGEPLAARIDSQAHGDARVDCRRGDAARIGHAPEELDAATARRCAELAARYRLRFAGIDLVRRPDGRYVFLELNPNGQWAWLEQRAGLPLAARLADLLEAGAA